MGHRKPFSDASEPAWGTIEIRLRKQYEELPDGAVEVAINFELVKVEFGL